MEVEDVRGLRAIEAKVTAGRKNLKPPAPVHHPARASSHPLPHGPGIKAPKIVRKKKQVPQGVGDRLLGYIQHVNRVHG